MLACTVRLGYCNERAKAIETSTPIRNFLYVPLPPFVAVNPGLWLPRAVADWNPLEVSGIFWIAYKLACIFLDFTVRD
jgi:hypothetical protein